MPNWVTRLNELKHWFEMQPSVLDRGTGRKLFAEVESAINYELRAGHGSQETTSNFVAMSPTIIRLVDLPTPACSNCGAFMKVTRSGDGVYVVDHCGTPDDCPEAFKMWKVRANTIEFSEQVLVPPFVREAMKRDS